MKSQLERKWWFVAATGTLAALATMYLMHSAGVSGPYNFAQGFLYLFCFTGLQRGFSFAAWLAVLCLAPASRVREVTR